VIDALGRPVKILDPVALHLVRPLTERVLNRPQAIPAAALLRLSEDLDRYWTRRGHLIIAVYALGLILCYAGGLFYRYFISSSPNWDLVGMIFHVAQFVLMLGAFYATWAYGRRARRPRVIPVMLRHRRCPHCGYDIRDLTPDGRSGATICPECGSAWNLNDATTGGGDWPP
jgi:hypothetical protein